MFLNKKKNFVFKPKDSSRRQNAPRNWALGMTTTASGAAQVAGVASLTMNKPNSAAPPSKTSAAFFASFEYQVAVEFIKEYYVILSQNPSLLHQFYNEESTFLYVEESDRETPSVCGIEVSFALFFFA